MTFPGSEGLQDRPIKLRTHSEGRRTGTGAGDAAIVFGYMKMLDPTSVVREGEQATTRNAVGVPEAIRGMYNQRLSAAASCRQKHAIRVCGRKRLGNRPQTSKT